MSSSSRCRSCSRSSAVMDVPPGETHMVCRLPTGPTLSRLVRARLALTADGKLLAADQRECLVDVHRRMDFPYYYWGPYETGAEAVELEVDGVMARGAAIQKCLGYGLEICRANFDLGE